VQLALVACANCAKTIVTREGVVGVENRYVVPEVTVTVAGMDKAMSQTTREEVLKKLRRRYQSAGPEYKRKLLDEAQGLLGYHRKAAIRSLRAPTIERGPRIITGRPVTGPCLAPSIVWLARAVKVERPLSLRLHR